MKLKVIKPFTDKFDHRTEYKAGSVLEFDDELRCADLIRRGLCKSVKEPEKSARREAAANEDNHQNDA